MRRIKLLSVLLLSLLVVLATTGPTLAVTTSELPGSADNGDTNSVLGGSSLPQSNGAPTADAGSDINVTEGSAVTLTGSGDDPDGDNLTYSWSLSGEGTLSGTGQEVTYEAPTDISSNLTAIAALTVFDGTDSVTDTVTINVIMRNDTETNEPPTADASGPYEVSEDAVVELNHSASNDPDGNITEHSWDVISGPGTVTEGNYTVLENLSSDANATVELTVTDDSGATDNATAVVDITEINDPPTVDANGPYRTVRNGSVEINPEFADTDGFVDDTSWELVSGRGSVDDGIYDVPVVVANNTTATIELTVTDDDGASVTDTATVIHGDLNTPPTARTNGPYSVTEGRSVTLNGTVTDPDDGLRESTWRVINGSGTVTDSAYQAPEAVNATTEITVELVAVDTYGARVTNTTTITIRQGNTSDPDDDGGGGGAPSPTEDTPPILSGVDPDTEIQRNLTATNTTSVEARNATSLRSVTFETGNASGTVQVTEYLAPPENVTDAVETQLSADTDAPDPEMNYTVYSVVNIAPANNSTADSGATVEFRIDRETVEDPDNLDIAHRAANGTWTLLNTTVESTTDTEIVLTTSTESFSLFAIVEAAPPATTQPSTPAVDTPSGSAPSTSIPAATEPPAQLATEAADDSAASTPVGSNGSFDVVNAIIGVLGFMCLLVLGAFVVEIHRL